MIAKITIAIECDEVTPAELVPRFAQAKGLKVEHDEKTGVDVVKARFEDEALTVFEMLVDQLKEMEKR